MHMIVYTSRATNPNSIDIEDIVRSAVVNNMTQDITGALFFDNGTFLQVLEGDQAELSNLMAKIEADSRHRNINVLIDQPIQQRTLTDWSMQQLSLEDLSAFHELNIELFSNAIHHLVKPRADQFISSLKNIFSSPDVNRLLLETI